MKGRWHLLQVWGGGVILHICKIFFIFYLFVCFIGLFFYYAPTPDFRSLPWTLCLPLIVVLSVCWSKMGKLFLNRLLETTVPALYEISFIIEALLGEPFSGLCVLHHRHWVFFEPRTQPC
jgi:hypothetical protein